MSWHYSQALVAAYSQESCLVGAQSVPLRSSNIHETASCNDKTKDTLNPSPCGMMFAPSMENPGEELLTWFLAGFLAKILAPQEEQTEKELRVNEADCGAKWQGSFVKYDPASHSWKTAQRSLFGGSEEFSEIWPRWGLMHDGACFPLAMLEHDTSVKESGLWGNIGTPIKTQRCRSEEFCKGRVKNPYEICPPGWLPNPKWVESLMGWPIGWTDSTPLGTDKFRRWQHSHGRF